MDLIQIGKFIATLRKKKGYTQEQLAQKLGVTGKTVSRWETGTYLPPVEMLQLLSEEYQVSINELLAGQILSYDTFRKKADENIVAMARVSPFTLEEKKEFYIRKWRRDHIALLIILALIGAILVAIPFYLHKLYYLPLSWLLMRVEHFWQNNLMMIYVENHLYDW